MRLTAVVLAAGQSSRMGAANKLLADLGGRPVLDHVLDLATGPPFTDAVVVTGCDRAAVAEIARQRGVPTVHNGAWGEGMGASLACATAALGPEADGLAVLLGDVPLIRQETLVRLAQAWRQSPAPAIARPVWRGRPGHPVIFDRAFVPDLLGLRDDDGARSVLHAHADRLVRVETGDQGVVLDADTPQALAILRARWDQ